jgi:hypothetical protein
MAPVGLPNRRSQTSNGIPRSNIITENASAGARYLPAGKRSVRLQDNAQNFSNTLEIAQPF